jgi:hypothetical protein
LHGIVNLLGKSLNLGGISKWTANLTWFERKSFMTSQLYFGRFVRWEEGIAVEETRKEGSICEIIVAGYLFSDLMAGKIMLKIIEQDKIKNVDRDDLIELGIGIALLQLVGVGLAGIINDPFLKARHVGDLHFYDKSHAANIATFDIEKAVAHVFGFRRFVRVQQRDFDNGVIFIKRQNGIEKTD